MKKKKKGFFYSLLNQDGDASMKRFVSLVGFILMCIAFCISIFTEVKIKDFIWDGMLWVVLGGLGLTVAEKFNYRGRNSRTTLDNAGYLDQTAQFDDLNMGQQPLTGQQSLSSTIKVTETQVGIPDNKINKPLSNNEDEMPIDA